MVINEIKSMTRARFLSIVANSFATMFIRTVIWHCKNIRQLCAKSNIHIPNTFNRAKSTPLLKVSDYRHVLRKITHPVLHKTSAFSRRCRILRRHNLRFLSQITKCVSREWRMRNRVYRCRYCDHVHHYNAHVLCRFSWTTLVFKFQR